MGNRAVIKGKGSNLGVYVHWNGGYDSVLAFTQYCKLKGYRSPECDDYGVARLCQVIGNYFGGSCSVGVWNMHDQTTMNPELVDSYLLDNGVYEIEDWEIVAHWDSDLVAEEYHEGYDLKKFLCEIDEAMPVKEQLGKDFILADVVKTSELKVGDKVYVQIFDERIEIHTVMGFAGDDEWDNGNVSNLPYVDLYDHDGDWSWNGNNYIRGEFVRKVAEQNDEQESSETEVLSEAPMKVFRYSWYDSQRIEHTAGIVYAKNIEDARICLQKTYKDVVPSCWDVEEVEISPDSPCEVYCGG